MAFIVRQLVCYMPIDLVHSGNWFHVFIGANRSVC